MYCFTSELQCNLNALPRDMGVVFQNLLKCLTDSKLFQDKVDGNPSTLNYLAFLP